MRKSKKTVSAATSLLDSFVECYTPETINRLASVRLSKPARVRVEKLATKANEGTLSPAERREYKTYIDYADVLALLHLKARRHLGLPIEQP